MKQTKWRENRQTNEDDEEQIKLRENICEFIKWFIRVCHIVHRGIIDQTIISRKKNMFGVVIYFVYNL